MRKLLQPKLLLFFALSIMSFYVTSQNAHAAQASVADEQSEQSYCELGKKKLLSLGSYCYDWCKASYNYVCSMFSKHNDNVKIQIAGRKKVEEVNDTRLCTAYDLGDEQDDHCEPGDVVCQSNMDYFNTAYLAGQLIFDGQGSSKIDQFDDKYCGYTTQEQELLYEHTDAINDIVDVSNEDGNAFDTIKKHYESIDYQELV